MSDKEMMCLFLALLCGSQTIMSSYYKISGNLPDWISISLTGGATLIFLIMSKYYENKSRGHKNE